MMRPLFIACIVLIATAADVVLAQANCNPSTQLCNPTRFTTVSAFIEGTLRVIVMLGIPVISFFIVYAGFLFVKARGDGGGLDKAKKNLLGVLIGTVLILGAWVIATLISQTVSDLLR